MMYFAGTGKEMAKIVKKLDELTKLGYSLLVVEYPGYGILMNKILNE